MAQITIRWLASPLLNKYCSNARRKKTTKKCNVRSPNKIDCFSIFLGVFPHMIEPYNPISGSRRLIIHCVRPLNRGKMRMQIFSAKKNVEIHLVALETWFHILLVSWTTRVWINILVRLRFLNITRGIISAYVNWNCRLVIASLPVANPHKATTHSAIIRYNNNNSSIVLLFRCENVLKLKWNEQIEMWINKHFACTILSSRHGLQNQTLSSMNAMVMRDTDTYRKAVESLAAIWFKVPVCVGRVLLFQRREGLSRSISLMLTKNCYKTKSCKFGDNRSPNLYSTVSVVVCGRSCHPQIVWRVKWNRIAEKTNMISNDETSNVADSHSFDLSQKSTADNGKRHTTNKTARKMEL